MNIKQFFQSKIFILFIVASFSLSTTNGLQANVSEETVEQSTPVEAPTTEASSPSTNAPVPEDAAAFAIGKEIFEGECSSCHDLDKKLAGPALRKVAERRSIEWLQKWIKNSSALIASGDPDANKVFQENGKVAMPAFPFKDEQIKGIATYLQYAPAAAVEVAPVEGAGDATVQSASTTDDSTLILVLSVVLILLILILVVLILMSLLLTKHLKSKATEFDDQENEFINQTHNPLAILTHPAFIGGVILITVLVGLWLGIVKGLYTVGTQGGYAPTQPINFSHKIHAGDNKIDCNYCHTGVRKSKNANIPSANICMNCHTKIKTDSPEIKKIYDAIDYNPETATYGNNIKPIQWIRIHNLPDLAYFNHAQHVKVGGIECQECHGPIQEMEKVYQYSELTMGWCIDCHRKTEVNAKGNAYYDQLLKLHQEKNEGEPMTVEDIGGLECSKCHY